MKRIFITALAASALAGALPATALARHHHARHHARHAHKARILRFESAASTEPSSPAPVGVGDATIGKVTSFENGVLVITLDNASKSTFEGQVTPETDVRCEHEGSSYGQGGDQQQGTDQGTSVGQAVTQHGEDLRAPVQSQDLGQNQDQGDCDDGDCGPESLKKEVPVVEAELKLSSAGAEWEKVEVVS